MTIKIFTPGRPIATGVNYEVNQSDVLSILPVTCSQRGKYHAYIVIGFGFACHWLKNWSEVFNPISKHNYCNLIINFDRHLKSAPLVIQSNREVLRTNLVTFIL